MSLLLALTQHVTRRPQRIDLLQQIAALGSITRAAKAAGMSYKTAWDAIDELNNMSGVPLVQRSVGGKGGGGARLTSEGERLVALYRRLEQLQVEVLQATEQAGDLDLLSRLMLQTSARNQLHGRVLAIDACGCNDLITLELAGDLRIQAQVTHDSSERLALAVGRSVVALIKAGWLELHPPQTSAEPGMNRLQGRIEAIFAADEGPSEVRISLPAGLSLCALTSPEQLRERGLETGQPLQVFFSPAQVLLGTTL